MCKYAFMNGIILDGTKDMKPLYDKIILVNDNKIVKISDDIKDIRGYEIVDLKGGYIMPGLINLHVHLPASGKISKIKTDPRKTVEFMLSNPLNRRIVYSMCKTNAQHELLSGVTTIRTVGGVSTFDTTLRDDIKHKKIYGPNIYASNEAITCSNGHMEGSVAVAANTKEEVYKQVDRLANEGVDLIKIMITGGVLDAKKKGVPGELKMDPELVKAACDRAHMHGLYVAAHCEGVEGVKVALNNGVDSIEHGAMPDDEMAKAFHNGKHYLCATLSPALPFALFDPSITGINEIGIYNGKVLFKGMIECIQYCLNNNIPVGLGNDVGCPYVRHYDFYRELCYFKKFIGVSNAFALHTATLNNANLLGIGTTTGSIEEGKLADMIVTKNNPLEDLAALKNVTMVVHDGIIHHPHIRKDKSMEKLLDEFL